MSEMSREDLLQVVRDVYDRHDPVPTGLVARMQEVAAVEASSQTLDLDLELMMLVESSRELAGTRSVGTGTTYTLRFVHGEVDLLVRVAADESGTRVDGWIVPPEPMTVTALVHDRNGDPDGNAVSTEVTATGRFELAALPHGLIRLRLEPHGVGRTPFATPTFEI